MWARAGVSPRATIRAEGVDISQEETRDVRQKVDARVSSRAWTVVALAVSVIWTGAVVACSQGSDTLVEGDLAFVNVNVLPMDREAAARASDGCHQRWTHRGTRAVGRGGTGRRD